MKGESVFQGKYHTTASQIIEGKIWQAGADPGVILLGISFDSQNQILFNTIHIANIEREAITEIDRGLTVHTFPSTRPRRGKMGLNRTSRPHP